MSVTDELLSNNGSYAASFASERLGGLPLKPAKHLAVLACMDARLDVHKVLGLQEGDAHVMRNAGGVVSDDVIRSLIVSQRMGGTTEIILIHHTDCGMLTFSDDAVKRQIQEDTGMKPSFAPGGVHRPRRGRAAEHGPDQAQPVHPAQERPRVRLRRVQRQPARGAPGRRSQGISHRFEVTPGR